MTTTTIRVDLDTRDRLRAIATQRDASLGEVLRDAVRELERREFALRVREGYIRLRADREAWDDYLAEAEATHVEDGLG
ncbi:MAG TPA: ribbon-helix-helix protein, CopG family [Iamia sp.]|nr:ribbon-helix-helix protein, CopG family [Iamia sp.]